MYLFIYLFPFAGAGINAGPSTRHTQVPVTYSMQRAPLRGSSAGQPAQFPSSGGPVPQHIYNEQAVQVGVNYPVQVPRETLAPCVHVPLPPPKEQGSNVVSLVKQCSHKSYIPFVPNRGQL